MRLTVTNPEVLDSLLDMPAGLLPIRRVGDSRVILAVKASREVAQTARLRGEFRFYLVPVHAGGLATYGLVTAFFDDHDEPLIIRTPLVDEEMTQDLVGLISSDSFYVHFFDEHNRELLGFRADNQDAHRFRVLSNAIRLVSPTLDTARLALDTMQSWFGARSPSADAAAFTIRLRERLFPDRLEENAENPGDQNELEIAMALTRPFGRDQVSSNPIRADNGREFVDVLVATTKTLLLVQAKDSPSTESVLTRKMVRKRANAVKHVRKATAQLKGSINHLRSGQSIDIITEARSRRVSMSGRDVFGLVIVKELFDPDRLRGSRLVLTVYRETGIPCLLLDHTEFQQFTFFRTNEESFVRILRESFRVAHARGIFPRSRFGLRMRKSVVYDPTATGNAPGLTTHERIQSLTEGGDVTSAPMAGDWIAGEAVQVESREDFDADWLNVVVDRSEVEGLDVSRTAATLSCALADKQTVERYRGRVDLTFFGYSNDPRELRDIREVRRFCAELDDAFPYWFYFLSTDRLTLGVIASCLCSVTSVRPGVVGFGADVLDFMRSHYEALNWLFDNYSLDERLNVERSGSVAEYFGRFEPVQ